jgi:hypothetical protein
VSSEPKLASESKLVSEPKLASESKLVLPRAVEAAWFEAHLRRLRSLPAHGNRQLFCDQLFHGLLLSFFDPMLRSLRRLEDRGDFDHRLDLSTLDLPRLARSTTSDALSVFDPLCLLPIIEDLQARCPSLCNDDPTLHVLSQRIIAADGTYFTTCCDVLWALRHTKSNGRKQAQVRVNLQFDVATWTPQVISLSGDDGESEPEAFARDLLPGVLYVADRNFLDFGFMKAVLERGSEFVIRVKSSAPKAEVRDRLELTPTDREAGVTGDEIVHLTGRDAPELPLRRVTIQTLDRTGKPCTIILLTSLVESQLPAHVIAAVYRQRWQIELFFKWLKTFVRLEKLLSTSRQGMTFQLYVMVIATLLMYVQSGTRVSLYALTALSWVANGTMSLDQAMAVIAKREREKALERERKARQRARKKLA